MRRRKAVAVVAKERLLQLVSRHLERVRGARSMAVTATSHGSVGFEFLRRKRQRDWEWPIKLEGGHQICGYTNRHRVVVSFVRGTHCPIHEACGARALQRNRANIGAGSNRITRT